MLTVASKICEKITLQQFSNYLQRNGLLNKHNSGNRKYHPIETLNIMISDYLLDAMDNKRLSALILLHLSKAFDNISHSILLQKLSLVAADKTTKWFESYLTDRTQVIHISTSTSTPLPIAHGRTTGRHTVTTFVFYLCQ